MNVIVVSLKNFGSFETLDIDFSNQGLTLVHGPTGSGKSTLCDAVPWVLFGRTAKNGAVDDVLRWQSEDPTVGEITVDIRGAHLEVVRTRGRKTKDNDLHYKLNGGPPTRGKDIPDTQRLINGTLGMDVSLYLSGAYFHEFSETAAFFTASAKNRRAICEQLVNLSLPIKLQAGLSKLKQVANKARMKISTEANTLGNSVTFLERRIRGEEDRAARWEIDTANKIKELDAKGRTFLADEDARIAKLISDQQAKNDSITAQASTMEAKVVPDSDLLSEMEIAQAAILELTANDTCQHCGAPTNLNKIKEFQQHHHTLEVKLNLNRHLRERASTLLITIQPIELPLRRQNTYSSQSSQLLTEVNPHQQGIYEMQAELQVSKEELKATQEQETAAAIRLSDVNLAEEVNAAFRSTLIQQTIKELEGSTNRSLSEYFEAEIRVTFQIADADKLEVSILKDGNECVYAQLSKGQRQLLKLCFGVSVMKCVSNHHGIKFSAIFLDEPCDGLDERLKLMTYRLMEELASQYSSVFVIDHSTALKAHFINTIGVSLSASGSSEIEKT